MKKVWLLWWSCLSLSAHCSTEPGVVMRVTQKWLDYIRKGGLEVFRHLLLHDSLPNIIGSTHLFGRVEYAITGIFVLEFNTSLVVAVPVPPTDVHLTVEGAKAKVYGQWAIKHWLIKDSGSFSLVISGVSLAAQLTTFKDSSSRPAVSLSACYSEVHEAKLHLSGGASWFYNLFTGFLEKPIKNNLNQKLCPNVNDVLKILQKELTTFQVTANLDAHHKIAYGLISPPRVNTTHIDLHLKGTAQYTGAEERDFNTVPLILPETTTSMMLVGLSEHFFNTLGKTYFMSAILKLELTQEQYPNVFWLRTGDYGSIIPQMNNYYPVSEAMILTVRATKPPVVHLTSQLTMDIEGELQALVVLPNLITKEVFSVPVGTTLVADAIHLLNQNLTISFNIERFQFYEFSSAVGPINVTKLEVSLGQSLQESILHAINNGLQGGFPMPILDNVTLQESAISITPGCLVVSMDMDYIPWSRLIGTVPKAWS
ncbi:BPI fold-containing family C protein-like isoform X2 [Pseudophryne corroboree]